MQGIGQVANWIDVGHFTIGNEAGEQCPVFRADLVTGEERLTPIRGLCSTPIDSMGFFEGAD